MTYFREKFPKTKYYTETRIVEELHKSGQKKHRKSAHNVAGGLNLEENDQYWYKENKHGDSEASVLEVAFANVAQLFFNHRVTPLHRLVAEEGKVTGLVIKDIKDTIKRSDIIYLGYDHKEKKIIKMNESGRPHTYFLTDIDDGVLSSFFKDSNITIDLASLASALCSSYVLEDDDLHKGNMGFYIEQGDPNPIVKFFKIDHDLTFSDSIMSRKDSRLNNILYNENSFNFSINDIVNFPWIKAGNHYWPTKSVTLHKFYDLESRKKVYTSAEDRNAFKALKDNPDFKREKWKSFLKHILIPEDLIVYQLCQGLDASNDDDFNKIQLVKNSVMERQKKLEYNLLAIAEFRQYFDQHGREDMASILVDLKDIIRDETDTENQQLQSDLEHSLTDKFEAVLKHKTLGLVSDSPLITSIRSGEYRFDESYKAFKKSWNKQDSNLDTPLLVAINHAREQLMTGTRPDPAKPSTDYVSVVKNLLYHGASQYSDRDTMKSLRKLKELLEKNGTSLEEYRFKSRHLFNQDDSRKVMASYPDLKDTLRNISEDSNLPLKLKKIIATDFIRYNLKFMDSNTLATFKSDINGMDPNMKFISQLRSELWIVRIIRGLYGNSSTLNEINTFLGREAQRLSEPRMRT